MLEFEAEMRSPAASPSPWIACLHQDVAACTMSPTFSSEQGRGTSGAIKKQRKAFLFISSINCTYLAPPSHYSAAPSSDRASIVFGRSRIRRGDCGRNDRPGSAATIASAHSPSACAFSSSSSTWIIWLRLEV